MTVETLRACVDCLVFAANGEFDHDMTPSRQAEIEASFAGRQLVPGDSEKDDEFSWHPCQVCGSPLGGSRHEIAEITTR